MEENEELEKLLNEQKWKKMNKRYLFELQKFVDIADNIDDEKLKKNVTYQMIKCDKTLTKVAEEIFDKIENKKHNK